MTTEEIKSIEDLQGTAGFRVMKFLIENKIKKLNSVSEIVRDGMVAEQAIARQLAVEVLKEFLSDMGLVTKSQNELRKTYE